jgi:recombinational DNA repair protein RecR
LDNAALAERLPKQKFVGRVHRLPATTMEGEATAHYLKNLAEQASVVATRIAFGVPMGGELEYVDGSTLSHAISSRRAY